MPVLLRGGAGGTDKVSPWGRGWEGPAASAGGMEPLEESRTFPRLRPSTSRAS